MAKEYIYTLTPSPALDLSGHLNTIIPNEKNYVFSERRDPGGNGINAARIAYRLDANVTALGFIGGSTGDEIEDLLRNEGIETQFTRIASNTRTNVTVTNDSAHTQTRLTFPSPLVSSKEIRALFNTMQKLRGPGILVVGGSLPKGCERVFFRKTLKIAKIKQLNLIVDAPPKFIKPLLKIPNCKILLVKPNQSELEDLAEKKLRTDRLLIQAARSLTTKSKIVCVSLAERGALLVTSSAAWFGKAPKVKARGTVGAGDSMVGAMSTRLLRWDSYSLPQLLNAFAWGLAAGAATAEAEGTTLAEGRRIRELRQKIDIALIR